METAQGSPPKVAVVWPALAALGLVVGLSIVAVGLDLVLGRGVAERTEQLVENSLRSIALAGDLRYQAHRLVEDRADLISIAGQIGADAREYDPIATSPGERPEWTQLQQLLDRLQHDPTNRALVSQIEESIGHLITINQRDAAVDAAGIRELHHNGLLADLAIGAITALLAAGVGFVLVRSLRRQRQLVELYVESTRERTRELEAFAGRVAHDLRGPLAPIGGYTDMLSMGADSKQIAPKIRRSVDRMARIIDDLLALSVAGRPPSGKGDVASVIRDICDELHDDLREADVVVSTHGCAVACTPSVLSQVLRNVVSNSIKYRAPDRRLRLAIDAHPTGPEVEIAVVDNGLGMSPDAAARAFEAFYRASATRELPGNGLGLAIVKRTVESLGGHCDLSSEPNQGTTVRLHLPAA